VSARDKELVELIGERVCGCKQNAPQCPLPLSAKAARGRKTPINEETEDSVFGQVGELSAGVVYDVERSPRERDVNKGKCPGQKRLRRTLSKGCGGEMENKRRPEQGGEPPQYELGMSFGSCRRETGQAQGFFRMSSEYSPTI